MLLDYQNNNKNNFNVLQNFRQCGRQDGKKMYRKTQAKLVKGKQ